MTGPAGVRVIPGLPTRNESQTVDPPILLMDCDNYRERVAALREWGPLYFLERSSESEFRTAIQAFFERGKEEGFSEPELIDYLGISSPSILSLAGLSDDEELSVMTLLAETRSGG